MKIAIFDFDGTIFKHETFPILMDHLKKHPLYKKRYKYFFNKSLLPYLLNKVHLYQNDKFRYKMMQNFANALANLTEFEINKLFQDVAESMKDDLNTEVIDKLEQHAKEGFHIYIVSGTFYPLIKYVTKDLPITSIIATHIPITNGVYNSDSLVHVQGQKKEKFLKQKLSMKPIDWENSFSYADSYSDLPILQTVGNIVCVNPDDKLEEYALTRGWKIMI